MTKLNALQPKTGSTFKRKHIGRGMGSGKGKQAGRGTKGQKGRTGVSINGFEGGQMPLHRRLPKRGFTNIFALTYAEINLGQLQAAIDAKKVDAKSPITVDTLVQAGIVRRAYDGLRVLGNGAIKTKVNITCTHATKTAKDAIEKAGGSVTIVVKTVKPVERKKAIPGTK
jgi:large subunit ribosomal protein L15